jgi:DNA repair exonuclease SbcCD nuclease subunit
MKICLLGDCHIGMRGDSMDFHNYIKKFYDNIFFPYLKEHDIKVVYQLGDLFDRRKYINFNTLHLSKKYFFDRFEELDIKLVTLLGNHDVYFRDTLSVNSSEQLLFGYKNIEILSEFETRDIGGLSVDIVPWICEDNQEQIIQKIKKTKSKVAFGHFEINGFEMDRGNVFEGGSLNKEDLNKYTKVFSGHFHHMSNDGHIFYIGTPSQMTWADWNDPRGFHIFDTETLESEFIRNPYEMFRKITYDDTYMDVEYWKNFNYSQYKESYVKIIVVNKENPYLFDNLIDNLYKENVLDIGVVEDFTEMTNDIEDDIVDQAEDTMTILGAYIDSQNINVDSNRLKSVMREIYVEALNMDKGE